MLIFRKVLSCSIFLFLLMQLSLAQSASSLPSNVAAGNSSAERQQSCKEFVQRFYDWYIRQIAVVNTDSVRNMSPEEVILKEKTKYLSLPLYRAMQRERGTVRRENAGYDADFFYLRQEPYSKYLATDRVKVMGSSYFVALYGIDDEGIRTPNPDFTAELQQRDGRWIFVNFHSPAQDNTPAYDLLTVLKKSR